MDEDDPFDEFDPKTPASVSVGDTVPNFSGETTAVHVENFHEAIQKSKRWHVIISVPKCLDPVSTSMMAQLVELEEEFKHRQIDVYALVPDTKMSIRMWLSEITELCECRFNFPIIIDETAAISKSFGLVRPNERRYIRALVPSSMVVVVSPDCEIRLRYDNPITCGHNFMEILRATDSVQLSFKHNICTPANWSNDEEVFIQPHLNTLKAAEQFAKGFLEVRPWFRITSLPDEDDDNSTHS